MISAPVRLHTHTQDEVKLNKLVNVWSVYESLFHSRYVAKRYKKAESLKQYQQDIICQMTARYYAMLFNQQLTETGMPLVQLTNKWKFVIGDSIAHSIPSQYGAKTTPITSLSHAFYRA